VLLDWLQRLVGTELTELAPAELAVRCLCQLLRRVQQRAIEKNFPGEDLNVDEPHHLRLQRTRFQIEKKQTTTENLRRKNTKR